MASVAGVAMRWEGFVAEPIQGARPSRHLLSLLKPHQANIKYYYWGGIDDLATSLEKSDPALEVLSSWAPHLVEQLSAPALSSSLEWDC